MHLRRVLPFLVALLLALAAAPVLAGPAQADPLPADYSAGTASDVLDLSADLPDLTLASARVAHADTQVDSTGSPRSAARSANLDAAVVGSNVPVDELAVTAPPAEDDSGGLDDVDIPLVLDTGLISGDVAAVWAGDDTCPAADSAISRSTTTLAHATVAEGLLPLLPPLVDLTTASTTGSVRLVDNGGSNDAHSVRAVATGSIAQLTLLDDVNVEIIGDPSVTVEADGVAIPEVTFGDFTVHVTSTALGVDEELGIGEALATPLEANLGVATARIGLAVGDGSVTRTDPTAPATGSLTLLNLSITVQTPLGLQVAAIDLGLLPLTATAQAPAGGVECGEPQPNLPAPVIEQPADGSLTTDTTPTIAGTGEPQAEVRVVDSDGTTVVGTAEVDAQGDWSFVPAAPMQGGPHTLTATQQLAGQTSPESERVTFRIVDGPVITSPRDGETTDDTTPLVTGTGEPGADIDVVIDGDLVGSTTVDSDGDWQLQTDAPLADDEHTVDAVQTIAGGPPLEAEQVTFIVETTIDAPVITSPEDGEETEDRTPLVEGDGQPGAEVTVTIDGDHVGSTTVDDDGRWTLALEDALSCGQHTVVASQADERGNVSRGSEPVRFTVACPVAGDGGHDDGSGNDDDSDGALANTGAPTGLGGLALLGLALVATGGVALRRSRATVTA